MSLRKHVPVWLAAWLLASGHVLAEAPATTAPEPPLRASAQLLFKHPELLKAGQCVRYTEGGSGWLMPDPSFFLRGTVVETRIDTRRMARCPGPSGLAIRQMSRDEFIRHARAYPCVADARAERDTQIGLVRVQVSDWETPHARAMENAGRLYRGHFLDQKLVKGLEIELEADLLGPCPAGR